MVTRVSDFLRKVASDKGVVPTAPGAKAVGTTWVSPTTPPTKPTPDPLAYQKAQDAAAKAAGKKQTAKENKNTQEIIDTLINSVKGYASGRDQSVKNAQSIFAEGIHGIDSQYGQTVADLGKTQDLNEADETAKTYANRANRAREQQAILEQMQSQGAGETDVLRGLVSAFENADANQMEVTGSYYDSMNNVNSGLRQANITTENARRNVYGNEQEAIGQANENYYNNYTQLWTDAQRAAASNTNIDSAYSTAFTANFGKNSRGKPVNPLDEATKFAGKVFEWTPPATGWAENWLNKKTQLGAQVTTPTLAAGSTRLGPLKRAEGANLLKKVE